MSALDALQLLNSLYNSHQRHVARLSTRFRPDLARNSPSIRRGLFTDGLVVMQPVLQKLAGCLTDGLKAGAISHDSA